MLKNKSYVKPWSGDTCYCYAARFPTMQATIEKENED